MQALEGFRVHATDGEVGTVRDFFFDDHRWTVRYIVVETGAWLGRRVLISPISFTRLDWKARTMDVALTMEQVRNSPPVNFAEPISRQFERSYSLYYGYSPYWAGFGYWGGGPTPGTLAVGAGEAQRIEPPDIDAAGESHLRSSRDVTGYHIQASDGGIGHVDDFLVDDERWSIEYLRVDTSNWIGGKSVVLPHQAVKAVSWREQKIHVGMTKDQVRHSPREPAGVVTGP
jgi:hypothetical protein